MAPKGPIQPKGIPLAAWVNNEQVLAQHMAMIIAAFCKELAVQLGPESPELVDALTEQYANHLLNRHKDFSLILVPPTTPPPTEAN